MTWFRALAIDYDGTLSAGPRPTEAVLAALREAREGGLKLLLVTGRILAELRREFEDVEKHFDAIVAENGAVLSTDGVARALTAPVPVALDEVLVAGGVPFRRGQVLLACDGDHGVLLLEGLRRLGLDCQMVRNRGALMVLPAGVTKGTGVFEALGQLGISRHSALAVGDAENDQSLLDTCELGVAVANAVDSLRSNADVVLGETNGAGVLGLLRGPLLRGELLVEPRRWHVELGLSAGGPVRLPASQINLLVTGGSGSGKSYAAGLLAERLIALGYSVCFFDPEGDHCGLGRLRGVVVVGGREGLPAPAQLARIVQHRLGSVVVDLSLAGANRASYVGEALDALARARAERGVPHWVFVDEAHEPLGVGGIACGGFESESKGYCLVTWKPAELCRGARGSFDFLLVLADERGLGPDVAREVAWLTGLGEAALVDAAKGLGMGSGMLIRLGPSPELRPFTLSARDVEHVRHWHKYAVARLPLERRFYFRGSQGPTGAVAGNLEEFHHELRRCGEDVLRHHAAGSDFSRWIRDVIQDAVLADRTAEIETRLERGGRARESLRVALLEAVQARYLD